VGTTGVTARSGGDGPPIAVTLLPREPDVFDRVRGIFESDALKGRCVLFVGLGSGGSFVLRELVRSGVGRFVLIDHDRLDYTNVCRHELGLADVGRLKVTAMRDYVLDRNPVADVETHALQLDGTTFDDFFDICETAGPDLIVCGTDNRESRLLINRAALLQDIVALYGGVRRRAYAGQVVRVIPRVSPCYQCFIQSLPAVAADSEISSPEDAARVAYSDRPVLPEPGLSTDIAPVALLMAKLALVELTSDYDSDAFDSLRLDLVAPWFFWLNRREHDTPYAAWPPLLDRESGPGIMRWMGQYLERDESCPACGTETPTVSDEERAFFQADS
jgi:molybdopterin/thiamine biosynthesis adenylyltransferase